MTPTSPVRPRRVLSALLFAGLLAGCVDAPSATDATSAPDLVRYVIAPSLALVAGDGPVTSPAQASALADAFDRVDRFHMVIVRQATQEKVVDQIVTVTPGQSSYPLEAEVTTSDPNEIFLVTITALQGDTELFQAANVQVTATPVGTGATGNGAGSVDIPLRYSGPGATAARVEIGPTKVVLATGGTSQLGATVLDAQGGVIGDVPVSWLAATPTVAQVSASGLVTAAGGGIGTITATTPTGQTATARVYVVDGTLAYVQNGDVMTRAAAGGDAQKRSSGGGASAPTWGSGGLYWSQNGQVVSEAGGALFGGGSPAVSPDGSKIAADAGGSITFANLDGSNPTPGPGGSTPLWIGARTLLVSGGSIDKVDADGSNRTTVVPGAVGFPALGPGGQIAYVDNGSLRVIGGVVLADGVSGRPSWSGSWIVFPGAEGLMVVPSDGSAPPVALPGLGGATDPAWQADGGGGGGPPSPGLTGLDPDPPVPGQKVTLLGSGFDDIIKKNNRVFWPGSDGDVESEVGQVTQTTIETVMPGKVAAGDIRVMTRGGTARLAFVPKFGTISLHAATSSGYDVAGLGVVVTGPGGTQVAKGTTDAKGLLVVPGLLPGVYHLALTPPSGYELPDGATRDVTVSTETLGVEVELSPQLRRVLTDPAVPTVGVGQSVPVSLQAFDINDNPITTVRSSSWSGAREGVDASGNGLSGSLTGIYPSSAEGGAHYLVSLNGQFFTEAATVTSYIEGTVTTTQLLGAPGAEGAPSAAPTVPAFNVTITLMDATKHEIGRTITDPSGHYRFNGLLAGTYFVQPIPTNGLKSSPEYMSVTLGAVTPSGKIDFALASPVTDGHRPPGIVAIYKDYDAWGSTREENTLQSFGLVPGTDYVVRPTSELVSGIPAGTSLIILASLSGSGAPLANVNSPEAQANLAAFVNSGGWLLAHMADNVGTPYFGASGYLIPGMSAVPAYGDYNCAGLVPATTDHPFIRGPDNVLGTSDDMNAANVARVGACEDNHGALDGLPAGAEVLMREVPSAGGRPVYATYGLGAGTVVVTTLTIEWPGNNPHIMINHLWWTVMGGAAPPTAPIVAPAPPAKAMLLGPSGRSSDPGWGGPRPGG